MRNYLDGGEAILEAFRRLEVDFVMASPGSEWGALWEAFARQQADGSPGPRYLSCAHEILAVNLAMGYTAMTGRMQAVALHTGVGLLQGSMAIDAANRQAIPMVIVSGESVTYGERDGFDPGPQWQSVLSVVGGPHGLVDSITKWSHPTSSVSTLHEQLVRAGEMARRSPAGPVFMTIPIETMLDEWTPPGNLGQVAPVAHPLVPQESIEQAARTLARSRSPAIVAESIGRDPDGYEALVELAEILAIPVFETPWMDFANFPRHHPLYQGLGKPDSLEGSDVVLTLRSRAPWTAAANRPKGATVINIDETPFRPHMVHQNLQADVFLEGDAVGALRALVASLRSTKIDEDLVSERKQRWSQTHDRLFAAQKTETDTALRQPGISAVALCSVMNEVLPADTIYVNETITHRRIILEHLRFQKPQSWYTPASGGLGQGLGLALGVRLARKDQPVVALIGDGSFMYNPVTQCLALSQHEELPIMIVIFNNSGYSAMRKEHHAFYPEGIAANANASLGHGITEFDYADLAQPFGFHGERVESPEMLEAALGNALAAMRDGRSAIVNVMLDEETASRD